ncbi:MAG: sigma-70 family RNA polymerase sigma factor [Chlorobi bacterium]|nr:sigma-70 family RNA polymerase sigma factor [Chlorobiota bacterium]
MKFLKIKDKNPQRTDGELIELFLQKKNQIYLAELFNRYSHLIYLVCVKYLNDRETAKDAVMDLYEKLSDSLAKNEIVNFKNWIYAVSRNHCLMIIRKRSSKGIKNVSLENYFMEYETFLNQDKEDEYEAEIIREKVQLLKGKQRECIERFYFEKQSYKEIAEIISEPEKKVKSYLQNGKRNLRILFSESIEKDEIDL